MTRLKLVDHSGSDVLDTIVQQTCLYFKNSVRYFLTSAMKEPSNQFMIHTKMSHEASQEGFVLAPF